MKPTTYILSILAFSALTAYTAAAEDAISVVAACNKKTVSLDDTVQLQVKINGTHEAPPPRLTSLGGFKVVQGPGVSIVQVNSQSSIIYSYILSPTKIGILTIGPIEVQVGANKIRTRSIQITVTKPSRPPPTQNMFITVQTDKTNAYIGEQILLTISFYFKDVIVRAIDPGGEDFDGFSPVSVGNHTQGSKVLNGENYNVVQFQKLLFPERAGKITLDPVVLQVTIREPVKSRRQSFFDDPFGMLTRYNEIVQTVKSKPLTLDILNFPAEGKPASFNGVAGKLNLRATAEPKTVEEGEPVMLTVELAGECNRETLVLDLPTNTANFSVYDPETSRDFSITGGRLVGTKTYKQMWVPTSTNAVEIPRVVFSYFDVTHKKYVTLAKGPFKLSVTPAPGERMIITERHATTNPGTSIRILQQDIFGIKTDMATLGFTHRAYTDPVLVSMICAPPILLAGLAALTISRRRLRADTRLYRRVHASRNADSRLKKAREALKQQDTIRFYAELSDALSNFIADRLHVAAPQVCSNSIPELFSGKAVPDETAQRLRDLLDTCDFARFANSAFDAHALKKHYNDAQLLLRKLQKPLR